MSGVGIAAAGHRVASGGAIVIGTVIHDVLIRPLASPFFSGLDRFSLPHRSLSLLFHHLCLRGRLHGHRTLAQTQPTHPHRRIPTPPPPIASLHLWVHNARPHSRDNRQRAQLIRNNHSLHLFHVWRRGGKLVSPLRFSESPHTAFIQRLDHRRCCFFPRL